MTTKKTTTLTLKSPLLHVRTAYGTIAGALRDHVVSPSPRTYQALLDVCADGAQAEDLLRQAREVVSAYYREHTPSDAEAGWRAELDRALHL